MTKPNLSLKRRLLRFFFWLAGVALAFFTYGAFLGSQTDSYFLARYTAYEVPDVNIVPQPLRDLTASKAAGTTLSYYGNSFEVPWRGPAEQKAHPAITLVKFTSGQTLLVWAPTGKQGILYEIATDKKAMGGPTMKAVFAADIERTPYDQKSALLSISSAQVRFLDPPRVSARGAALLFIKAIGEEPELRTGVYTFQTPAIRGFQIGNPAQGPSVRLDIFDLAGDSLGEIVCSFGKYASSRGTQSELNRIIQTFHPVANVAGPSESPKVRPQRAASR